MFYNNWAISRALIGGELYFAVKPVACARVLNMLMSFLWSIRVQTMELVIHLLILRERQPPRQTNNNNNNNNNNNIIIIIIIINK